MVEFRFEWDSTKAKENLKNHEVSFEEAQTVFYDDYATEFYDDTHSEWEDRFLLLGLSSQLRLAYNLHSRLNVTRLEGRSPLPHKSRSVSSLLPLRAGHTPGTQSIQ